jgi:hypothetical protein
MSVLEPIVTSAGIIVPALLIALAVRRWIEPVSWRLVGLCLLLSFLFIARGVFTRDMPIPLDEVVRGYPYKGLVGEVKAKNSLTNDTIKQIVPWMQTVREQFAAGKAPLWNPYLFSGYPLLGNGQSAPFSPLFLVTLFVPLPKQLVAMAGLKLFLALLFGCLLIRREGVPRAAALLGSVAFAFAVFNNCFLYYPMTAVTLLLPAAAYAVLLALRERRPAPAILVAVVVGSLLAGGHPESVVHVALAVGLLVLMEWLAPQWAPHRPRWGDLGRVALAAIAGVFIAAPSWLPVLEQVLVSTRMDALRIAPARPVQATALWAMLNPDGFGNPAHDNWNWIGSYTHTASLYLGLIVTALLPGALLSRRAGLRDRLLVVALVLLFLISMNWTPLGHLFYTTAPLSWVAHDRLRFVVCFLAGILVARRLAHFDWQEVLPAATTSLLLVGLGTYVFIKLLGKTLTPISAIGLVCLLLFWIVVIATHGRRAALAACLLTIIDLGAFTFDYNAVADRRYYVPRLPIIEALKNDASSRKGEPFRILGLDWVFLPNAASQYRLEDVRGSDPMGWNDYARFFKVAEVDDPTQDVKRIADPEKKAVDFLNVRYLLTEPKAAPGEKWRKLYAGPDGELYENRAVLPRFFAPKELRRVGADWQKEVGAIGDFRETAVGEGKDVPPLFANPPGVTVDARERGPAAFELRIESPADAFVASSQPAMRGWEVWVNGRWKRPLRVNGAFLGFFVPAGESRAEVLYRPASFLWSQGAAVLGGMLLLLQALWLRPKGGKNTGKSTLQKNVE